MTESSHSLELPTAPESLDCEVSRAVLPWLIAGLGGQLKQHEQSLIVEWLEDDERRVLSGPSDQWRWGGHCATELHEAFRQSGAKLNSHPAGQPLRVHEISESLLSPYRAEGGRVHLGGCTMDWSPAWRVYMIESGSPTEARSEKESAAQGKSNKDVPTNAYRLTSQFIGADGKLLEDDESADLRQLALLTKAPTDNGEGPATSLATDQSLVLQFPVWRSWVHGRVVAEIGDESMSVDVEGWATDIARGSLKLPPFDLGCGQPSHCVALDDDGDIGPDTAIAVCAESNRRLLCSKMQRCGASEVWVLPKHVRPCPVTGVGVRESELVECNMCRQPVAPQAISSGRCEVCRGLRPVAKEDAQIARIIGEYPRLDQWSAWRIGESRDCLVLTAGRFFWRLLVVVKKEPLELVHAATGLRWIRGWTEAPEELKRELRSAE